MRILIYLATYRNHLPTLLTVSNMAHEHSADLFFSRDNPFKGDMANQNILYQYQRAQELAAQGYDYVLTVEDDMIIPPDALTKLLNAAVTRKASAVYGVYHFRRLSFTANPVNKSTGVSFSEREWKRAYSTKDVVECGGIGYGCTLFRADVFAQVPLESRNQSGTDSDTHLGEWMRKNGHKQLAHFGVLCGHIREDGSVLYVGDKPNTPRIHGTLKRTLTRVRVLRSFGGRNDATGDFIAHYENETCDIDSELADVYVSAGIVERIK